MKGIYKAFMFLLIFQMMAFTLGVLGVFPISMYSDIDFEDFNDNTDWIDYIKDFFGAGYDSFDEVLTLLGISGLVFGAAIALCIMQGSIVPLMMGIFGVMAIHMLSTSREFLGSMFEHGGVAVVYLGICLFVALGTLILFAIIEAPMGGDGG